MVITKLPDEIETAIDLCDFQSKRDVQFQVPIMCDIFTFVSQIGD
jgi:hypothetical protein